MDTVSLIGVDLGKHCFHLHGQSASGRMVFRKKLSRNQMFTLLGNFPSCTVVMEACAGAHWIARRFQALGHEAKLISPQFVKPFRQGNKNDFADAQAICEAASRPSMRFVSQHNEAQQIVSALHRVRESLVRDRTGTINQVHASLLEFGISLPRGMAVIRRLPAELEAQSLPPRLVAVLERLQAHFKYLHEQIVGRCAAVRLGSSVRGLDWPGPTAVQHRRKIHTTGHQQAWRQGTATVTGAMCAGHHAAHRAPYRLSGCLGPQPAGATALECSGLRSGQ